MSNKPYTTVQRLTIEALDCVIKPPTYDSQGHLHIFIEPRIPVESVQRNADPLLSQTTGQQQDTLSTTAVSSASPTSELPVHTDTITSQTDTTLPHLEDTRTSPTCRGITRIHRSPSRPSHPYGRQPHSLIFMSTLYKAMCCLPASS